MLTCNEKTMSFKTTNTISEGIKGERSITSMKCEVFHQLNMVSELNIT